MVMMINHHPETILSNRDLEDCIDKYMGNEAAAYYRSVLNRILECADEIELMTNSDYLKDLAQEIKDECE